MRITAVATLVVATASSVGVSTAQPGSQLDFRSDGTMKVLSKRAFLDPDAQHLNIVADIKNVSGKRAGDIRFVVKYRKRSGRAFDAEYGVVNRISLGKGQRTPLELYDPSPPDYHRYTIHIKSDRTRQREAENLTVTPGDAYIDDLGRLNQPVHVRNDNAFAVEHVFVYMTLFDRSGRILWADNRFNYTDPSALAPGQRGFVEESWGQHFQNAHRIRIQVEAFPAS